MIPLLDIQDLTVEFATRDGIVQAVKRINIQLAKGETLGIVGESGSGKSVTSYAVMRILDRAGRIASGSVTFSGMDLKPLAERDMRDLRGREMAMIFQNPRAALNPIRKVGHQIEDVLRHHSLAGSDDAKSLAIQALEQVRIARPEERYHAYPFELSGGMCQRIVIALAIACRPQLLIADEPTTGLDVTTQKAVMDLVTEITRERGMSTVLITHDLGLAATYCDRIVVMQRGEIVETAAAAAIFRTPEHAYTRKLVKATPRPGATLRGLLPDDAPPPPPHRAPGAPLLTVENLVKEYPTGDQPGPIAKLRGAVGKNFRAVGGLSFQIAKGENVGLVGESGCGKSTTSTMVMRLLDPTSGTIRFNNIDIGAIPSRDFAHHPMRQKIQMVFQDPTESLNPRHTAARAIADPLLRFRLCDAANIRPRVEKLATMVGLEHSLLDRFPHQLSGGQKARIGIARAIASNPDLIILDEPTAALDVSIQAIVLNLLADLQATLGMSYLFVSHDLQVVRMLCNRVIVMKDGAMVEEGTAENIMQNPQAQYTRDLLASAPHPPGG